MYSKRSPSSSMLFIFLIISLIQSISSLQVYNLNETTINKLYVVDRQVVICKAAQEKEWLNLFAKSYLKVDDVNAIKNVHTGYDLTEVKEQMTKWFNHNYLRLFINSTKTNLPLYSDYCVGLESTRSYHLTYHFNSFDWINFLLFVTGTCLFYSSNYLSKQIYIYYISHVTIGVAGSLLILTLIMHRFLPRRLYAFFVITGAFLNTYFVSEIKEYLFTYPFGLYLTCYIMVAAIISFAFAYYKGPVQKNHRLFDLFKWFLQFISLIIMFISSELTELIIFIIAIILLKYNLPSFFQILDDLFKFYRFYFPKPRKLLSPEEFEMEAQVTTERELEKLRNYCKSPQFNKWKAMKKMHNPRGFASFIDDGDHVSDFEVFEHLSMSNESQWTDDESDESIGVDD